MTSCAAQRPAPDKSALRLDVSSDRGAAVFGLAIDRPFPAASYYSLTWTCYEPGSGAICPERDPNSPRNAFGVPQRLNKWGGSVEADMFGSQDPLKQVRYFVMVLPPGNYILDQFVSNQNSHPQTRVTVFADRQKTAADTTAPRFTIRAGQAIYLGDFTIDASRTPVGVRVTRNEAAARAALVEYPNIKLELSSATLRAKD